MSEIKNSTNFENEKGNIEMTNYKEHALLKEKRIKDKFIDITNKIDEINNKFDINSKLNVLEHGLFKKLVNELSDLLFDVKVIINTLRLSADINYIVDGDNELYVSICSFLLEAMLTANSYTLMYNVYNHKLETEIGTRNTK